MQGIMVTVSTYKTQLQQYGIRTNDASLWAPPCRLLPPCGCHNPKSIRRHMAQRRSVRCYAMIYTYSLQNASREMSLSSTISMPCVVGSSVISFRRRQQTPSHVAHIWPFEEAWGVAGIDSKAIMETIPQNLFAFSLFPYLGFLYHLTKSKKTPPMTLFGFYFLLAFVFATIPAGIYAKKVYGTTLANVDYLHGSAEFLLTLTNLFIVLGLRKAIREEEAKAISSSTRVAPGEEEMVPVAYDSQEHE